MDFLDLAKTRSSVRAYKSQPVEEGKLQSVLEAARLAPSANNRQPWKFIVVTDSELRSKLTEIAGGQPFVGEAPVIIVAVGLDPERVMTCEVPAYAVDLSIAIDHMTLAAAALGLGTCWIGRFNQSEAKSLLNVPDGAKIVTLLPIGYPADPKDLDREKSRKPLDQIVCHERFR